jgi:hypothetical protein
VAVATIRRMVFMVARAIVIQQWIN